MKIAQIERVKLVEGLDRNSSHTYRLWESAGHVLKEYKMDPKQIEQLFKDVESGMQGPGNRTMLGQGKDAVVAVDKAWEELKGQIQNSAPIANVDAQYDAAVAKIEAGLGGPDNKVNQMIQKYRDFAKKHPIAQGFIYAALIAAAGISGAGLGGAAVLGLLKMTDKLLQGEKFSSATYSGAQTGALAYGAGQLSQSMNGAPTDTGAEELGSQQFPTSDSSKHVVQGGETLSQIAQANNTSVDALMKLNPDITNPDVLQTGQTITTPLEGGGEAVYQAGVGTSSDTMSKIASGEYADSDISQRMANTGAEGAKGAASGAQQAITNRAAEVGGTELAAGAAEAAWDQSSVPLDQMLTQITDQVKEVEPEEIRQFLLQNPPAIADGYRGAEITYKKALDYASKLAGDSVFKESRARYIDRDSTVRHWALKESLGRNRGGIRLTEAGVRCVFELVAKHQVNEGIMDTLKGAARKVGGALKQTGKNLANRITADKLMQAWEFEGANTDSDAIAIFLKQQGIPQAVADQAMQSIGVKGTAGATPSAADTAPAAPAADTAASTPAADAAASTPDTFVKGLVNSYMALTPQERAEIMKELDSALLSSENPNVVKGTMGSKRRIKKVLK